MEDISLPEGEKVDIIVSEWMGFYLLHESMLNSVIWARDNFLADDGHMFPSEARIYACPCTLQALYNEQISFWNKVFNFDLSAVKQYALQSKMTKPEVYQISKSDLLAQPACVKKFNLRWVSEEEVKLFSETTFVGITKSGSFHGLCLWFECDFDGRDYDEDGMEQGTLETLSTSPFSSATHWKQTVVVLGYGADNSAHQQELLCQEAEDPCSSAANSTNKLGDNKDELESSSSSGSRRTNGEGQSRRTTQLKEDEISDELNESNLDNVVEEDEVVGWKLVFAQSQSNVRHYTMTVEILDPEMEEHPIPCQCPMPRCLIIAKMLEKEEEEMEDDCDVDCT